GELAPKLALGTAHELAGRPRQAAAWYGVVAQTDPSYTRAAFGLARGALAADDPAGALAALDRVPDSSRSFPTALVTKAEILLRDGTLVQRADVAAAARIVEQLPRRDPEQRRLRMMTLERALTFVLQDRTTAADASTDEGVILGVPLTEDD